MKIHFILLSGGSGSRMKSALPKQFLKLAGKPVILHSAEVFSNWKNHDGFVCVSNPDYLKESENALESIRLKLTEEHKFFKVVPGGSHRHESTLAGIRAISEIAKEDDLLFFHDAARPLLLENELERLLHIFKSDSSVEIASLVSFVTETLIMGNALPGILVKSLDRNRIFSVKTPQVLKFSALKKLTENLSEIEFTDLLTWGEKCGIFGNLVVADDDNIKLTKSSDLDIMNAIFEKRKRNP